jgi:glycosyltransferase involved in cell wall biosynthesis
MNKLTTIVITYNESANIERCLQAVLPISDEVIVIDSFSTDETVSICQKHGVKVISRQWEGYSFTKNYGSLMASHDWILSVDADEVVSEKLAKKIKEILLNPDAQVYEIFRFNNYCGKWIRHGAWYPEYRRRLYHRKFACWNDNEVHEDIQLLNNPKVARIKEPLLHYSYKTIVEHRAKTIRYADIFAKYKASQKKRAGFVKLYLSPVFRFVKDYFFKLGFLDGHYGFVIAKETAYYTYLKYLKTRKTKSTKQ